MNKDKVIKYVVEHPIGIDTDRRIKKILSTHRTKQTCYDVVTETIQFPDSTTMLVKLSVHKSADPNVRVSLFSSNGIELASSPYECSVFLQSHTLDYGGVTYTANIVEPEDNAAIDYDECKAAKEAYEREMQSQAGVIQFALTHNLKEPAARDAYKICIERYFPKLNIEFDE